MTAPLRCVCGDTECASCGTAQGTRAGVSDRAYAHAMERVHRKHRHRPQRTRQIRICSGCGAESDAGAVACRCDPALCPPPHMIDHAECSCGATRRTERGPWVEP